MQGLLINKVLDNGFTAIRDFEFNEAKRFALASASNQYPNTPIYYTWTLTAWWLMKNRGRPFTVPQPWPLAAFYMNDEIEAIMGVVPNCLVLFDYGRGGFHHLSFDSLTDARTAVMKLIGPLGGIARDTDNGITFVFTDIYGVKREVGFAINIPK